jgi:hypothetical protein
MPAKRSAGKEHVVRREDGAKLRSGFCENDEQTGDWTT